MIRYENDCNCCEVCMGCGLRRVPHCYCDGCGEEVSGEEELKRIPSLSEWLCEDCYEMLLESLTERITANALIEGSVADAI